MPVYILFMSHRHCPGVISLPNSTLFGVPGVNIKNTMVFLSGVCDGYVSCDSPDHNTAFFSSSSTLLLLQPACVECVHLVAYCLIVVLLLVVHKVLDVSPVGSFFKIFYCWMCFTNI
uniref:Uncharacterized protein n=1 Tax=Trypanosoma congolense (strain IL3000) TaxID=1068625 RepID=G0UQY4_TRYCI|nr:hypothetical protein, unlikely [Trypanosoma congolense IL3000]